MSYGEDVHDASWLDFKQCDISRGAKGHDELPQKRIVGERLAAGNRRETQSLHAPSARIQGTLRRSSIAFGQEAVQSPRVVFRLQRQSPLAAFASTAPRS